MRIKSCWLFLFPLVIILVGCNLSPTETLDSAPVDTITTTGTATSTDSLPTASPTPTERPPVITYTPKPSLTTTNTPGPLDNYPAEGFGPARFPNDINPLTGLPASRPGILDRRPIAVKISNGPRGIRPQWGLSLADHVFEYYQEAGRTRFNAIFYGQDASVTGPIRSARFVDEEIIRMYKSFFAFGNADARVLWRLFSTGFGKRFAMVSDAPCPPTINFPLCRIDPNGYNHLITDTTVLSEHFIQSSVDNSRQSLEGFFFQALPPEGFSTGDSITIRYSNSFYNRWDYDPSYGQYVRYQDTIDDHSGGSGEAYEILHDKLTGEPIRADNVIVLLTKHSYFSRSPEMWEINLFGYGIAYLFRDGYAYEVSWARTSDEGMIILTHPNGDSFPVRPGNTWFQILGTSSPITTDDANWHFEHVTP